MTRQKPQRGVLSSGGAEVLQVRHKRDRYEPTKILRVSDIKPRANTTTRLLSARHLIELAESIAAVGLLEPLVIDRDDCLLAGGHRLGACLLLCADPRERGARLLELCADGPEKIDPALLNLAQSLPAVYALDPDKIPTRVINFSSLRDPGRALLIEATENEKRRDYTPTEVRTLYRRLLDQGYVDRRGRLAVGEKAAQPTLAVIIGKSIRTVQRMLAATDEAVNATPVVSDAVEQRKKSERRLIKSTQHYLTQHSVSTARREAAQALLAALLDPR